MEQLTLNTPALLFSAISLIMLAYTNRFLAYAAVIRNLHDIYLEKKQASLLRQIKNLKIRLNLTRWMQIFGISSLLCCVNDVINLRKSANNSRLLIRFCTDAVNYFFGTINKGNTNLCTSIATSYCRY